MKIVALVPVKLNNVRLPNKNTKEFTNGKPLITYILETLKKVKNLDEIYVYCSSEEIKKFLPNGVKYLKRSKSLDQNTTKINEVLASFSNDVDADIYVQTHATAPFVKEERFEEGLDAIINKGYDSALTVKKLQDFLWKDGKPFNYSLNNIPRTQDLDVIYEETSGFYIYKKEVLKEKNCRIGEKPYLVEISEIESIDIDEAEDFIIADAIYNQVLKNKKVF